jgi:very-short-patch-repair endonuclease
MEMNSNNLRQMILNSYKSRPKPKWKPTPSLLPLFAENLRKNMTNEELILWPTLRDLGFLSQVILCGYVADFSHHHFRVIVELDGAPHFTPSGKQYDKNRDDSLRSHGWKLLHFENKKVRDNFRGVVESIRESLK